VDLLLLESDHLVVLLGEFLLDLLLPSALGLLLGEVVGGEGLLVVPVTGLIG